MDLSYNKLKDYQSLITILGSKSKKESFFPDLQELNFKSREYIKNFNQLLEVLKEEKVIKKLNVKGNFIQMNDCIELRRFLTVNKSIKYLNLSNCNIDRYTGYSLAEGLRDN